MATHREYFQFILEQLSDVEGITHRQMMGEYILCLHGKIAAYLCDDRLLVKPVPAARKMMPTAPMEPPYEGAKEMLLCDRVDDRGFLKALFDAMEPELPVGKKRKK